MNSGHYADDVQGGGLGKAIIIGVVVICTALSFTLGYFVGKYSAPLKDSGAPVEKGGEVRLHTDAPPALGAQAEGVPGTTLPQTQPPAVVTQEEERQVILPPAPAANQQGSAPAKPRKQSVKDIPASGEAKRKGTGSTPDAGRRLGQGTQILYTVQLGAFRGQAEAEMVKEKFDKKGYKTYITVVGSKGEKVYKVRTGEFAERKDAEVLALRLKKAEGLAAFVTFSNE